MKFDTAFTPTHKSLYGVNLHGLIGAGVMFLIIVPKKLE